MGREVRQHVESHGAISHNISIELMRALLLSISTKNPVKAAFKFIQPTLSTPTPPTVIVRHVTKLTKLEARTVAEVADVNNSPSDLIQCSI